MQRLRGDRTERRQTTHPHTDAMMMMMMTKSPVVLVACALLLSSLVLCQASFSPDECCFKFLGSRVPKKNVVSYRHTDNRCPMAGVLLKMKKGAELCADPAVEWVQKIIETKDKFGRAATTMTQN